MVFTAQLCQSAICCGRQRLHASHTLLDVAEFRAVGAIARFPGQSGNFLRHGLRAISGIRMVAEELWASRHAALFFQLGEEVRHGTGIETAVVHDVGSQQVGFRFRFARVLQEIGTNSERKPHLRHLRERALAHHSTQNCQWKLCRHLFAGRARAVPLHDVGNLVGDHACQLGFVVRRLDGPQIYKNRAARKSERR